MALRFDLAARVHRPSKKPIVLPKLQTTRAQAQSLAAIYMRVVTEWANAAAAIVAAYSRALAKLQMDAAGDDTKSAMDSVEAQVKRLILLLTPDLRQWAMRVEQVQRGKWVRNVLSAASVDLNTVLTSGDVNDTLGAVVDWNVSLVKDVSDETRRRIANAVFTGFQQRKPADQVAKEIVQAVGMARSRARRIAADQTSKLGARLNRARREQAGIGQYKWRHSAKRHPRSWHVARDGKIYKNDDPRIPAGDRAGEPPFCGCTEQAVLVFDD
jgi:SPP1 gp7 family putative phage head morphogenesis protein